MSTAENTSFLVGLGLSPFRRVVVDVSGLIPPFRPPGGGIDQPPLITRTALLGGLTIGLATGGDEPVIVLTVDWPTPSATLTVPSCRSPARKLLEGLNKVEFKKGYVQLQHEKDDFMQCKIVLTFLWHVPSMS